MTDESKCACAEAAQRAEFPSPAEIDSISGIQKFMEGMIVALEDTCPRNCSHRGEVNGIVNSLRAGNARFAELARECNCGHATAPVIG